MFFCCCPVIKRIGSANDGITWEQDNNNHRIALLRNNSRATWWWRGSSFSLSSNSRFNFVTYKKGARLLARTRRDNVVKLDEAFADGPSARAHFGPSVILGNYSLSERRSSQWSPLTSSTGNEANQNKCYLYVTTSSRLWRRRRRISLARIKRRPVGVGWGGGGGYLSTTGRWQ